MSDANTVYIETLLKFYEMDKLFDLIYTNPAAFDSNGKLVVQPLVSSNNPHGCSRCEINICKGLLIRNVKQEKPSQRTVYVGDGRNDYCPALFMESQDVLLVRHGFTLHKMLEDQEYKKYLKCSVRVWKNYEDLCSCFLILIKESQ